MDSQSQYTGDIEVIDLTISESPTEKPTTAPRSDFNLRYNNFDRFTPEEFCGWLEKDIQRYNLVDPSAQTGQQSTLQVPQTSLLNSRLECTRCFTQITPRWHLTPGGHSMCNLCNQYLRDHALTQKQYDDLYDKYFPDFAAPSQRQSYNLPQYPTFGEVDAPLIIFTSPTETATTATASRKSASPEPPASSSAGSPIYYTGTCETPPQQNANDGDKEEEDTSLEPYFYISGPRIHRGTVLTGVFVKAIHHDQWLQSEIINRYNKTKSISAVHRFVRKEYNIDIWPVDIFLIVYTWKFRVELDDVDEEEIRMIAEDVTALEEVLAAPERKFVSMGRNTNKRRRIDVGEDQRKR